MSGQGSPNFVFQTCTAKQFFVLVFVAALLLNWQSHTCWAKVQDFFPLQPTSVATNFPPHQSKNSSLRHLRLRLSWGGGEPQIWNGDVTVIGGVFSHVAPLGLDPDSVAAVTNFGENLKIQHWSPTNYGGADVTLTGNADTRIRFELSSNEEPDSRFERTMTFDELVSSAISGELDLSGNRCSVSRVPGDELAVSFEREHLVFKPGESFTFSIHPNSTTLSGRTANCRIRLVPAHPSGINLNRAIVSETLIFQMDESGTAEAQDFSFLVPDEEAVYNIEIELDSNRYQASFGQRKNSIRRIVQFLVLAEGAKKPDGQAWRQVSSVEAVDVKQDSFPAWSQLSRIARLPSKETLGNDLRSPIVVEQQSMMRLLPGGWQAIPLSIDRLHQPHIIELEYVADGETAIGVSLLQPDASGQIPAYGFDSGVYIPKSLVTSSGNGSKIQRHRLTIWPETKTPYLLVANRHGSANAILGSVKIFAGPDRLDPGELNVDSQCETRKLMAFYEAPLFPENFAAREEIDPTVGQPLDDWRMFYEGADRFIEYLNANSYRGAFITVACDGSSIYPSQLLSPSPKHDNGIFFSTGQDPIRKDILEMLFRMFEREGLVLVPTLALSGPLPAVEILRNREGLNSEFELVDLNGTKRPVESNDRLPVYNPLNRTVQRAVHGVVQELAERYKSFRSFDGVAIVCRPDTYTMLPGRQWGYDEMSVQQFLRSQPDLGGLATQWSEIKNILLGSHRQQWIAWRAAQMTQWYEELAAAVNRALPNGRLYLAPVDLYRSEETASALSPSLHSSSDFEQVMLNLGFEANLGSARSESNSRSRIVFLNPHRIAPDQTLSSQRVDLAVENSKQAQEFFRNFDYAGDLYTHRISWAHFAQLQEQSPFGDQQSSLMRLQQMAPADTFNRKRFAQSIKNHDARILVDGGRMMVKGQEESILEMMQVYNQLPDLIFSDVVCNDHPDPNSRPLAVRQLQIEDDTYFYAANASPWPIRVRLLLSSISAEAPVVNSLSNQRLVAVPAAKTENSTNIVSVSSTKRIRNSFELSFELPAYGLVGGRMKGDCQVFNFGFELPDDADEDLRRHVFALQAKLTKSGNPGPIEVLENSSFESNGRPTMDGWDTGQQPSGNVRLETNQESTESKQQMGRTSLLMKNELQDPVWVRSNVFEATDTGRISISVWLKTNDPAKQPPLRLALEGQSNGTNYYRFGSVGSLAPDSNANQLEARWKRFAVHFDDLPLDGISNVRIGFDLMGPGQVKIDNVQVFDRWFDEHDAKAITQMLASTGPLLSNPATFNSCRGVLTSYWPSFLDQFIEIEESGQKDREALPGAIETQANPNELNQNSATSNNKGSGSRTDSENNGLDSGNKEPVPMFRRIRKLVPQRKPTLR